MAKLTKMQINRITSRLFTLKEGKVSLFFKANPLPEKPNTRELGIKEATKRPKLFAEHSLARYRKYQHNHIYEVYDKMPAADEACKAYAHLQIDHNTKVEAYEHKLQEEIDRLTDSLYLKDSDDGLAVIEAFKEF